MSSYKEESNKAKEVKRGNIELRPVSSKAKKYKKFDVYCWLADPSVDKPFYLMWFGTEDKPSKVGSYIKATGAKQALDKHKREWSNRGVVLEYKIIDRSKNAAN
jgi:hypothetical protein